MNFPNAVLSAYRKAFSLSGRAIRSEFWWFVLFYSLIGFAIGMVETQKALADARLTGLMPEPGRGPVATGWLIFNLAPLLTLTVRRLHDCEVPGWFVLVPLIPSLWQFLQPYVDLRAVMGWHPMMVPLLVVAGVLIVLANIGQIYLTLIRGTEGTNAYGPDPLAEPVSPQVFE